MKYFPSFSPLFPSLPSDPSPMKHRTVLSAALSVLVSATANAGTETLFEENFTNAGGSWTGTGKFTSAANANAVDNQGWTFGASTYVGPSSMRLGSTSVASDATTPSIARQNKRSGAKVTLSFLAASRNTGNGRLSVDVLDENGIVVSTPIDSVSMKKLDTDLTSLASYDSDISDNPLSFQFDTPDPFSLVFRNVNSTLYVLVDSILVTDFVPDPLSAPATLALSGTAGANDFAVTWSSVANAEGYSVKLLDSNDSVVSSNDVAAATTSASFTGLVSSSEYTVVVVALGNYTTTDDSAPKTLDVETAASAVAVPTLVIANTSWTAGVAGTSAVSATLEGNVACEIERVRMSDGSTATVANGVFSWTPPAANAASTVVATFHVLHGGEGWYIDQALSVAATPAPSAPSLTLSNATAQSFEASWSSVGGPVVEYKIRAWTGRATPDDATGSASENFNDYLATTNVPTGWTFMNTKKPYNQEENPVDFRNNNEWVATPDYGGTITSVSFRLRRQSESGSTFKVYGSTGSADPDVWKTEENTLATLNPLATQVYTIPVDSSKGISRVFFQYTKASGNVSIGSFSVSGTDWPAANFLEDWGGAKVSVGTATLQTFSNPVPGTANYVEVTAIGPTGLSARTIDSIAVPAAPRKPVLISIQ